MMVFECPTCLTLKMSDANIYYALLHSCMSSSVQETFLEVHISLFLKLSACLLARSDVMMNMEFSCVPTGPDPGYMIVHKLGTQV